MKRIELKKITLIILGFVLANLLQAQIDDLKIYENYTKSKRQVIPSQYVTQIELHPDSTYIDRSFQGTINDSKENYLDWRLTELKGKWYFDKEVLILRRGDIIVRYKMTKRHIRPKRFQIGHDGAKVIHSRKWILEKSPKYKLIVE